MIEQYIKRCVITHREPTRHMSIMQVFQLKPLGTFIIVYSGKNLNLTNILIGRNLEPRNIKPSDI